MKEVFPSKSFQVGFTYQRKDIDSFLKEASVNLRSGIFAFKNGIVLFVTLDKTSKPKHHKFKDFFDGKDFYWESQPPNAAFGRPTTPSMSKLLNREVKTFLFARIRPKLKSQTLPYFYCGELDVVSWDDTAEGERPFGVHFQCTEIGDQPEQGFKDLLTWKPEHTEDISEAKLLAATASNQKNNLPNRTQGQGRETDTKLRKAIELYATQKAFDYYSRLGYKTIDVSQEKLGYDMHCEKDDSDLFVEIKGTRGSGWTVTVTSNEVSTAEEKNVDLFITNNIKITGVTSGEYVWEGGEILRISPWKPRDPHYSLQATEYRFTPNIPAQYAKTTPSKRITDSNSTFQN